MIAFNTRSLCKEAEPYYYDFLREGDPGTVPSKLIDHVRGCEHCRTHIEQLQKMLDSARTDSKASKEVDAALTMLRLHFAYIGKPVTCETARPFIPALLDPALGVRIPTPITVHIDHCHSCAADLQTIRELNLTRGQLCELSQLYADKPRDKYIGCEAAQDVVVAVARMTFDKANAKVLKHLCLCPYCRKLLFEARRFLQKSESERTSSTKCFACSKVSASDIFDYVVPYGLDPANDSYAKFRESLVSHVRTCPSCLAKMQHLHETIYGIAERAESGVVTEYEVDASAKVQTAEGAADFYAGFPIRVESTGTNESEVSVGQTAVSVASEQGPQRIWLRRLKPLAAVSTVAAAVIVVVVLLLSSPAAKAVTIEHIYQAIDSVKNICISSFVPDKQEPVQQVWISRKSGLYVARTETKITLWSVLDSVMKTRDLAAGVTERTSLDSDAIDAAKARIYGSLGIMPFNSSSDIPEDAKWSEIPAFELRATAESTKVYELGWAEKAYDGSTVQRKWRVLVDASTNLPQRVQWFIQSASDTQPVLELTMVVEYPSDQRVQNIVNDMSF